MADHDQHKSQGGVTGLGLFIADSGANDWWPPDLGAGSIGAQNSIRYAYFPGARRLAVNVDGQVTIYDTGELQIGEFLQPQREGQSLLLNSQFGLVSVADLPVVSGIDRSSGTVLMDATGSGSGAIKLETVKSAQPPDVATNRATAPASAGHTGDAVSRPVEVLSLIEEIAELHSKGVLTDAEFETKKAELLSRL